jgi:type II secretory ATPase GspE/PulE/Tfp pilus assembly ATPase PilB-like protein
MSDKHAEAVRITVGTLPPDEAAARLVDHAAALGASDLFLTPTEENFSVHARLMGVVRQLSVLPADLGRRCVAHIKATAGMDVAEKRRPQDGRWIRDLPDGSRLDLRINLIPTLWGEDLTLRLLPRETKLLTIDGLGMRRTDQNQVQEILSNPSGLLLVTGPTGSGKTTSLYAFLAHVNTGQRKINTIEDPIEYTLEGVRQSQINPRIDVGFPELLRSVLRQSPDVIMIGEVRDPETAETAVRAANSGHLVLATLHAPVAAGAVQSMLGLGVHPHFLASSLRGAVAQRLVRTLCPKCRVAYDVSESPGMFDEVRRWLEPEEGKVIHGPGGCPECRMLGYVGRSGVFEVLTVSKEIRKLIADRQPTQVIRQRAVAEGMTEFRAAALLKVAKGETSIEEVFRVVPTEYLDLDS